ncbi:MAG: hypothetical protein HFE59_02205 [Clostridiales bacterium]|jgi:hypothetical protein|nr:hypothetical protein [Clostridiales bacterium]
MKKIVLSAASCYNKKYYINPNMEKNLPSQIKDEIKALVASMAEKLHCIFTLGFYENGNIYIETSSVENDFDFDEIGAKLETEKIKKEKAELLNSLNLWFKVTRNK